MEVDTPEARRRISAAIFGNRAAADVISAIDELTAGGDRAVTTRMVARKADLGDSVVRPVMLRLQAAGAIRALPRTSGARSALHYEVQPGDLWNALSAVINALPA